jgi:hypothetical protein
MFAFPGSAHLIPVRRTQNSRFVLGLGWQRVDLSDPLRPLDGKIDKNSRFYGKNREF